VVKTMTFNTNELLNLRQAISNEIESNERRLVALKDPENSWPHTVMMIEEDLVCMKELHEKISSALKLV
jgi:hypothetical protein